MVLVSIRLFAMMFTIIFRNLLTLSIFFFFNDTATTEIYTLSLHDALPISRTARRVPHRGDMSSSALNTSFRKSGDKRSEEHTSELQSQSNLVCRLLLEKKKTKERTESVTQDEMMKYGARHSQSSLPKHTPD